MAASNAPLPIFEDCGLGFCLSCIEQYKNGKRTTRPAYAITAGPVPVPIPGPNGTVIGIAAVAVPACYEHVGGGEKQQSRALLVSNGRVN